VLIRDKTALFLLLIVSVVFSGCTMVSPFPLVARSGDTITLAVGSADGMNKSNTTVEFTGSDGIPINIPERQILKIYPDKTSRPWLYSDGGQSNINIPLTYPSHGPWEMIGGFG